MCFTSKVVLDYRLFDVGSTDNQREISELSYKRSHRVSEEFCPWTPAVGNLKPWLSISFVLLLVRFIFALSELWFNFVWSLESFELLKSSSHEFWIHFLFWMFFRSSSRFRWRLFTGVGSDRTSDPECSHGTRLHGKLTVAFNWWRHQSSIADRGRRRIKSRLRLESLNFSFCSNRVEEERIWRRKILKFFEPSKKKHEESFVSHLVSHSLIEPTGWWLVVNHYHD